MSKIKVTDAEPDKTSSITVPSLKSLFMKLVHIIEWLIIILLSIGVYCYRHLKKLLNRNADDDFTHDMSYFSTPSNDKLSQRIKSIIKSLPKRAWASIFLIFLIIVGGVYVITRPPQPSQPTQKSLPKLSTGTPNYQTILPSGKTITQLGGWVRISPDKTNPVYAYVDKIGKVKINVSQQPLPDVFKHNTTAQIAQLAMSYNATDKFTAGNNVTVYLGSGGTGQQSVIFTKSGLLILIKSSSSLSNNEWARYISTLK